MNRLDLLTKSVSLVKLTLDVRYPDDYPEVLPELELEPAEGDFDDDELSHLREELHIVVRAAETTSQVVTSDECTQGEENLGLAMTFTLVSHLREQLAILVKYREEQRRKEEAEKERLALEVSITLSSHTTIAETLQ